MLPLLVTSFVAGVLTILAPCVLPLLPVTLGGSVTEAGNKRRPFIIIGSLALSVFAFTLLLKGSTALISVSPDVWTYVSAAILIAFGLTLVFPEAWAKIVLKLPGHRKPDAWLAQGYTHRGEWWADVLVGAALGPVFTTCSPTFFLIIATVLPQSLPIGILDLLAYILGMSLSLLAVAHIGQRLIGKMEWAANPYGWFRKSLGALFIVVAILIAFGLDKQIESAILRAGFFDVTSLEQKVRDAFESAPVPSVAQAPLAAPSSATQGHGSSAVAVSDDWKKYPVYTDIVKPAGFINSAPFTLADYIGKKVILVDFIDYSCINCQRTFPFLNKWWDAYKDQGLLVVAIHTPEFSFEKDQANVAAAAKRFGLQFPIVLDNEYATWNAYKNQYWPHKFLIDIHGRVVYEHIGEGGDDETEAAIVRELAVRKQFLGETGAVKTSSTTVSAVSVDTQSPETYFGSARNEYFGNGRPFSSGEQSYKVPDSLIPNAFYLGGDWNIASEYAEAGASSSSISYSFNAMNVYIVAATADGSPADARVLIDGSPISPENSGKDVTQGAFTIDQPRLYHLYSSKNAAQHRIDVIFSKKGARAYTFTFG